MPTLTLSEWAQVAEVLLAAITFVGILISMWLSVRALREIQQDRKARQRPCVAFDPGAMVVPLLFRRIGRALAGVDPDFVEKTLASFPEDGESCRNLVMNDKGKERVVLYGALRNFGVGPALNVRVVWTPTMVWVGSDSFAVDQAKLREPLYGPSLNSMPACPANIVPEHAARLSRLPAFIAKDHEKKIARVDSELGISYEDVFGDRYCTSQVVRVFTDYAGPNPSVTVTFSKIVFRDQPVPLARPRRRDRQ